MNLEHVNIGKASKGEGWQLRFTLSGKRRTIYTAGDEAAARFYAGQVDRLIRHVRSHGTPASPPPDLAAWARGLEDHRLTTLYEFGLVDSTLLSAALEVPALLNTYIATLRSAKNRPGDGRIESIEQQTRHVLTRAKVNTLRDLTRDRLKRTLETLTVPGGKGGAERELSSNSRWAYGQSVSQFCEWLRREKGLIQTNPAEGIIPHGEAETTKRPLRRAEQFALLAWVYSHGAPMEWTTAKGTDGEVRTLTLSGPDRWALYRFAIESGARLGTISQLTAGDFVLKGDEPPHARIRREITKAKIAASPIIGQGLADFLRVNFSARLPKALAFDLPPNDGDAAEMIRRDLAGARAAWIAAAGDDAEEHKRRDASDFLAEKDHHGNVATFHSLRYTCILNMLRAAKSDTAIITHVGHASITTTRNNYLRTGYLPSAAEDTQPLPNFDETAPAVRAQATGTHDVTPLVTPIQATRSVRMSPDATPDHDDGDAPNMQFPTGNTAHLPENQVVAKSTPERTRTFDPLIKSHVDGIGNHKQPQDLGTTAAKVTPAGTPDPTKARLDAVWPFLTEPQKAAVCATAESMVTPPQRGTAG